MANSDWYPGKRNSKNLAVGMFESCFYGENGFNAINQKLLVHPNLEVVKLLLFFNIEIVYLY